MSVKDRSGIETIIKNANHQREKFLTDKNFAEALGGIGANTRQALTESVINYLLNFDIKADANLEELAAKRLGDVELVGETYHFARKMFLTSYDAVLPNADEFADGVLLVNQVFNELTVFRDPQSKRTKSVTGQEDKDLEYKAHATAFLRSLSGIINKKEDVQQIAVQALMEVLPEIGNRYKAELEQLNADKKNAGKYGHLKLTLDRKYIGIQNQFLEYARDLIWSHVKPDYSSQQNGEKPPSLWEKFARQAGLSDQEKNGSNRIYHSYLVELLSKAEEKLRAEKKPNTPSSNGGNANTYAIRALEEKIGLLTDIAWSSRRDSNEGDVNVYTTSKGSSAPQRHQMTYQRRTVELPVFNLLLAMCDHISATSQNPAVRIKAQTTKSDLSNYLGHR